MHICYLADARSPIAKNWISHFVASAKHKVTVISSYPCAPDAIPGAHVIEFPFALSALTRGSQHGSASTKNPLVSRMVTGLRGGNLLGPLTRMRSWIAPIDLARKAKTMSALVDRLRPDLVHAMRLPYEGFLAAVAVKTAPLLISLWGNDFTFFADHNHKLGELADAAMRRADALHCDCRRDLKIAFNRGFSATKPWRVLPGNGGIDTATYFKTLPDPELLRRFEISQDRPLILNPRGFRAYIRNDTFFRAIPLVLKQVPDALFIATEMAGNSVAQRWVRDLCVKRSVRLLPSMSREDLASLFAASQVSVSPSSHDGTPNTLLEAMACGCFPVVGNVASMREWIVNGENGFICDEADAESLASCIVRALQDETLRNEAAEINRNLVQRRAEYATAMAEAEKLYDEVAGSRCHAAVSDSAVLSPNAR
jgi:glycosyltransferase involved in cell wall biosynthesis